MLKMNLLVCIITVLLRKATTDVLQIDEQPQYNSSLEACHLANKQLKCTCSTAGEKILILEENSTPTDIKTINIQRCKNVMIGFHAIRKKTNLRTIILKGISNLILENRSIYRTFNKRNSFLSVQIINSNISNIPSHSFKGISQIIFKKVSLNTISPYAFNSITNMMSMLFFETKVNKVKRRALHKLSAKHLIISRCDFKNLSSESFSNIDVYNNFYIINSNVSNVKSEAFNMYYVKRFKISNSNLRSLKSQAFKIRTESVSFERVIFYKSPSDIFSGIRRLVVTQEFEEKASFEFNSVVFKSCSQDVLKINKNSFNVKLLNTSFKYKNGTNCPTDL